MTIVIYKRSGGVQVLDDYRSVENNEYEITFTSRSWEELKLAHNEIVKIEVLP